MTQGQIFNAALQLDRAREKRRLTSITHAAIVRAALEEFAARHARVYVWLAMPDHLHVLFSPYRPVNDPDHFVGRIKQRINAGLARRGMHKLHWREAVVHHPVSWETAPQSREYILQNPVRGLLVEHAEDWPHKAVPENLL